MTCGGGDSLCVVREIIIRLVCCFFLPNLWQLQWHFLLCVLFWETYSHDLELSVFYWRCLNANWLLMNAKCLSLDRHLLLKWPLLYFPLTHYVRPQKPRTSLITMPTLPTGCLWLLPLSPYFYFYLLFCFCMMSPLTRDYNWLQPLMWALCNISDLCKSCLNLPFPCSATCCLQYSEKRCVSFQGNGREQKIWDENANTRLNIYLNVWFELIIDVTLSEF